MHLDHATCRRARLARDARFDGCFFVAVRTTGIFCRPICPAVAPRERNVTYFPTAAAAAEAGYRACLRCRPECAPGTPAWAGASTTIARALRLIGDPPPDGRLVEHLSSRLGIGSRHLRRLFLEHLGASPIAVVQTRRLLSAKHLIDQTELPLTTVAMAAGFGSVRRFNAAFLASYGCSPTALRRGPRGTERGESEAAAAATASPRYSLQLRYRPPFDWSALTAFLAPRATPGVESVTGATYRRSIEIGGQAGWLALAPDEGEALRLDIEFPEAAQLLRIVARVRRMGDLDADPRAIDAHLAADRTLRPLLRRCPGLRVPGAWDGFELGVRAILGQQVSVKAATALAGRLVARFGRPLPPVSGAGGREGAGVPSRLFPSPAALAEADVAVIGMPEARAEAIRAFARQVACGQIVFDGSLDPALVRERLRQVPGIGEWTTEYIALRALGDPDAFPAGDLGLLRATGAKTVRELRDRAEAWRPWRGYAALHLWASSTATAAPRGRSRGGSDGRRG